jgi:hypothetical protein
MTSTTTLTDPLRRARAAWRDRAPIRLDPEVRSILRCPTCASPLDLSTLRARCRRGHRFPMVSGVPVFLAEGRTVERRPLDHPSNQAPSSYAGFFAGAAPWLHLGAGSTGEVLPGSIELETVVFRNTHVVGDVHRLPFADASLGGAMALNVFEHLEDPERAAAELRRVVRPGGLVLVQTAFLQPLHADPYHFYNATETGVRRWFRHFEDVEVGVPGNFNPAFALSWMASDLLHHAPGESRDALAGLTVADLASWWRDPGARSGPGWDAFMALPDAAQRVLAAGFEIRARRPS